METYYFKVTSQSKLNTITNPERTLISSIERFKNRIWDSARRAVTKHRVTKNDL